MISPSLMIPSVDISQLTPPLPQSSLYKPGWSKRFSKYLHGSVSRWARSRIMTPVDIGWGQCHHGGHLHILESLLTATGHPPDGPRVVKVGALMPSYEQSISDQYGQSDLSARILTALQEAGKDIDSLATNDLSSFDQYHSGGLAATRELASLVALREGMRVLDVGSGVGGPARTLATEYGCDVTGIDLTEEYCLAAEMLTARLGLEARVRFQCGSALDMPFDDGAFDVVWMQNSSMNIPDKEKLYSEVRRVLRPGGSLATQDVLSGAVQPLYYPVPWATDPSLSTMIGAEDFRKLLGQLGFTESAWSDGTELAMKSARERLAAASTESPSPIGQGLIVSQDIRETMTNTLRNYEEGRALIVMSVFERA